METINNIVREMRKKADQADFIFYGNVDASFVRIFADRVEKVFAMYAKINEQQDVANSQLHAEIGKLRAVVDVLRACDGVRNCISKGCDSCRHQNIDCNSRSVIEAVKAYEEVRDGE